MESKALNHLLSWYVIGASISVSLFVSPWNSIDPVNLPKLMLLGILGSIAGGLAFGRKAFLKNRSTRSFIVLVFAFITWLIMAFFVGQQDLAFKLYGTAGRNTGTLAYICLTLILFASAVSATKDTLKKYSYSILGVGALLGSYGFAQSLGLDFFDYVNAYGTNVFGTFGNPNFQSAFMGMVAAVAVTLVLFSSIKIWIRVGLLFVAGLALFNVTLSSEQGYLNFLAGVIASLLVFLFSKKNFLAGWAVLTVSSLGGFVLLLGIFNQGPLADIIYKSSLQARGFYWRAAVKMILDNPLFGVGPEGFGDWYRRSRSAADAAVNYGIAADTAHSVPLDIGASGGVPLLLLYLALMGLGLLAIIKISKRATEFDVVFASIVAAWVAYQAQSVISINQLGLGVWGWSLTGLLIGYEINSRDVAVENLPKESRKTVAIKEKIPASALLIAFAVGGAGFAVSLPPYLAANKYYKALQSGDANVLIPATYAKPYDRNRFLYTAQVLAENKLDEQAIKLLRDASKIYPDSFDLWSRWAGIPTASPAEIATAKAQMIRLDPYNPTIK